MIYKIYLTLFFNIICLSLTAQFVLKGQIDDESIDFFKNDSISLVSNKQSYPRNTIRNFKINDDGSFLIDFKRKGIYRIIPLKLKGQNFETVLYFDKPDTFRIQIHYENPSGENQFESYNLGLNRFIEYELLQKGKLTYEFIQCSDLMKRFIEIESQRIQAFKRYSEYAAEIRKSGKSEINNYNWQPDVDLLNEQIKSENNPEILKLLYITQLNTSRLRDWGKGNVNFDDYILQKAYKEIEPDSPVWSYYPSLYSVVVGHAAKPLILYEDQEKQDNYLSEFGKPYLDYINLSILNQSDETIKPDLLEVAIDLSYKFKDFDLFQTHFSNLKSNYYKSSNWESIEKRFTPTRKIQVGKKIPEFEVTSIDNSDQKISDKTLKGNKYILNFWASWCNPCIRELKLLESYYPKLKEKGIEVVSFSLCYSTEDFEKFRKEKVGMSWLNSQLVNSKTRNEKLLVDFEVISIPKDILVDRDGKIEQVGSIEELMSTILQEN